MSKKKSSDFSKMTTRDIVEAAERLGINVEMDVRDKNKLTCADVGCKCAEMVNHPAHYGGKDNPYEAIKVIEAWGLDFHLGNAVKYISRAGKKNDMLEDLKKARWYLDRKISVLECFNDVDRSST